jgi:uncharacterized membrane protein
MSDFRRELAFQGSGAEFNVILKRNCSISPAALLRVFALVAVVSMAIGLGFAAAGAWMILPFAGIEVLALGIAFLVNGRHAGDYERIAGSGGRLTVEIASGAQVWRHEFDARTAKVEFRDGGATGIVLRDTAQAVALGRHLDADSRAGFGAELARRLKS